MITVYHVDDSPLDLEIVKAKLEKIDKDLSIVPYTEAREALEELSGSKHRCDCILSDFQMPLMSGLEFLQEIRARKIKIPFIFFTGQGNENIAAEALRSGADDYFSKDESIAQYQRLLNSIKKNVDSFKTEKEHIRVKELQRRFFDLPLGLLLIINLDGEIVRVNPTWKKVLGFKEKELIGKRISSFVNDGEQDFITNKIASLAKDNRTRFFVNQYRHKNGSLRTIEWSAARFENEQFIYAVGFDVTPREIAEIELRRSEERFRLVANSTSDLVYEWHTDDDHLIWFGNIDKSLGYEQNTISHTLQAWESYIHEDDRQRFMNEFNACRSGKDQLSIQYRIKHADGSYHIWNQSGTPLIRDDSIVYIGSCTDVTAAKNHEQQLEFQSLILNSIRDAVLATDCDGIITYGNAVHKEILGIPAENLIGKSVKELGDDSNVGATQDEIIEQTLREGAWSGKVVNKIPIIDASGEAEDHKKVIFLTRTQLLHDDQNQPIGMIGISTDITENQKILDQLRQEKSRLDLAVEGGRIGLWDWDITSKSVVINEKWADIVGYSYEELKSKNASELKEFFHPDDSKKIQEALDAHFKKQKSVYEVEARMQHKKGHWVKVLERGKVFTRDADGKPIRMVGVLFDISDKTEED